MMRESQDSRTNVGHAPPESFSMVLKDRGYGSHANFTKRREDNGICREPNINPSDLVYPDFSKQELGRKEETCQPRGYFVEEPSSRGGPSLLPCPTIDAQRP